MAKKFSPWLRDEILNEFSDALDWRQADMKRAEKAHIKREPGLDGSLSSDDEDEKYDCNGSSIIISLTRPTNLNSRVQIVKFDHEGPRPRRCELTDGQHRILGEITAECERQIRSDLGLPTQPLVGATVNIRNFELLLTHLGAASQRITIVIQAVGNKPKISDELPPEAHPVLAHDSAVVDLSRRLHQLMSGMVDASDQEAPKAKVAQPAKQSYPAHDNSLEPLGSPEMEPLSQTSQSFATQPPSTRAPKLKQTPRPDEVVLATGLNLARPIDAGKSASLKAKHLLSLANLAAPESYTPVPLSNGAGLGELHNEALSQLTEQISLPDYNRPETKDSAPLAMPPPAAAVTRKANAEALDSVVPSMGSVPEPNVGHTAALDTSHISIPNPDRITLVEAPAAAGIQTTIVTPQTAIPLQQVIPYSNPEQTTKSSHQATHRAPSAMYVKYARRRISDDQAILLGSKLAWLPPLPGASFPVSNVPLSVLDTLRNRPVKEQVQAETSQHALRKRSVSSTSALSDEQEEEPTSSQRENWPPTPPQAAITHRGAADQSVHSSPGRSTLKQGRRVFSRPLGKDELPPDSSANNGDGTHSSALPSPGERAPTVFQVGDRPRSKVEADADTTQNISSSSESENESGASQGPQAWTQAVSNVIGVSSSSNVEVKESPISMKVVPSNGVAQSSEHVPATQTTAIIDLTGNASKDQTRSIPAKRRHVDLQFGSDEVASQDPSLKHKRHRAEDLRSRRGAMATGLADLPLASDDVQPDSTAASLRDENSREGSAPLSIHSSPDRTRPAERGRGHRPYRGRDTVGSGGFWYAHTSQVSRGAPRHPRAYGDPSNHPTNRPSQASWGDDAYYDRDGDDERGNYGRGTYQSQARFWGGRQRYLSRDFYEQPSGGRLGGFTESRGSRGSWRGNGRGH